MRLSPAPTQQNEYLVVSCLGTDAVGDVIYFTGNDAVSRVDMTNRTKGPGAGIIVTKRNSTSAIVQTRGFVRGVYTSLTAPGTLFVSDAGRLVSAVPQYPTTGVRYAHRFARIINPTTVQILHEPPVVLNA